MSRRPTSQSAFTLIEVMLAATILLVGFAAVVQAVTMGAAMIDTARKQQIAQQIIDGEIAGQRSRQWTGTVPSAPGISNMQGAIRRIRINDAGTTAIAETVVSTDDTCFFSLPANLNLMAVAHGFTCEAQATNLRSSPAPTLLVITYTVKWTGSAGRKLSRTGVAHFGENGLQLSYRQ